MSLHASPLAHVTGPRATLELRKKLEHGSVRREWTFFHTIKAYTYTSSVHMPHTATCRTLSSCCHFADSNKSPSHIARSRSSYFLFFFETFPTLRYSRKRRPICRGNEVRGDGRKRKGGKGRLSSGSRRVSAYCNHHDPSLPGAFGPSTTFGDMMGKFILPH